MITCKVFMTRQTFDAGDTAEPSSAADNSLGFGGTASFTSLRTPPSPHQTTKQYADQCRYVQLITPHHHHRPLLPPTLASPQTPQSYPSQLPHPSPTTVYSTKLESPRGKPLAQSYTSQSETRGNKYAHIHTYTTGAFYFFFFWKVRK